MTIIMAESLKRQQIKLDQEKWYRSITTSCDQSGGMYYCEGCARRVHDYHCNAAQEERVAGSICARNLRRIKKEAKQQQNAEVQNN